MLPVKTPCEHNISVKMLPVLLLALWVCGCSPQRNMAHRLAGSNLVVVTNTADGFGILITGEEVSKIVQAIAAGKKESRFIAAAVGLRLEFYQGTQHLENVVTADEVFVIDQKPYRDTTGTLKALYERCRGEHRSRLSP